MATLVMNTGRVPRQVGVILPNGKKATTRIMGRGRGTLAPGVTIDKNWMALNGKNIRVVEQQNVAQASTTVTPVVPVVATVVTPVVAPASTTPTAGSTK
jgi:hypothetical protein